MKANNILPTLHIKVINMSVDIFT